MKLRATISIDFEAEDAIEARSKKREIESRLMALRGTYEGLSLVVTERRPRLRPRAPAPVAVYRPTAGTV